MVIPPISCRNCLTEVIKSVESYQNNSKFKIMESQINIIVVLSDIELIILVHIEYLLHTRHYLLLMVIIMFTFEGIIY